MNYLLILSGALAIASVFTENDTIGSFLMSIAYLSLAIEYIRNDADWRRK
jgi:hypothetical protein